MLLLFELNCPFWVGYQFTFAYKKFYDVVKYMTVNLQPLKICTQNAI